MFGYIVPEKPELKVREYELYRGYYCGMCKAIGQKFGQTARLTLNYDFVLLAIVADSVQPEKEEAQAEHCVLHPLKKRLIVRNNTGIDFASDMHILLAYYKLRDDYDDEHSLKGLLGSVWLQKVMKKLMKKYPNTCIIVREALAELAVLEKSGCQSLDQVSELCARMMQAVFSVPGQDAGAADAFEQFGFHLGKWIYILDAYDDRAEDSRTGAYNPFLLIQKDVAGQRQAASKQAKAISGQEKACGDLPKDPIKERAEFNLLYHLGEMARALSRLRIVKNKEIIENILYLGMLRKTEEVLSRAGVKGEENESI